MMIMGMLGKFGALFVTIPNPVIGGVFMVMFGKEWHTYMYEQIIYEYVNV